MDRRLMLDEKLRDVQLEVLGYQHTYFEPPESVKMKYDAIVYERTSFHIRRADDKGYLIRDEYQVMVISHDPETKVPYRILKLLSIVILVNFLSEIISGIFHLRFTSN